MPELPEVEMYARYFARHALGRPMARVRLLDERILGRTRKSDFLKGLSGQSFRSVRRHGKHLFANAGKTWLHLHFGMTGDLASYRDEADKPRFARMVIDFRDGSHLAFEDMRLFGYAELVPDPDAYILEHRLGPDPLDDRFGLRDFRQSLAGRRGAIKAVIMSQHLVAGVGNLYADETFFRSGIDPRRKIDALSADEIRSIFHNMRRVLQETIAFKARGGEHPRRALIHFREEGDRCPRCGGTIARTVVGGRTTYYCSRHQR